MPDTDDLALWWALSQLMINYWSEVDNNGGSRAHEFYLPDALFAVGANQFEGAKNIQAFYDWRRHRSNTTTRHLISNLQVFRDDAQSARMVGVMSLYRAEGRPPIEEARPLAMIADFEAHCVLGDNRIWRFQSHVLRPVFIGANRPHSVAVDPERLRMRGE